MSSFQDKIDPIHLAVPLLGDKLSMDVFLDKYAQKDEQTIEDMAHRVVHGIYSKDANTVERDLAYEAMVAGLWMPAGRILAGAGTAKIVTLMNCYVTGTIKDSMAGIHDELKNFALTMQQGGGDGADFSTLRPENSILTRTGTKASGPLPFMDEFNAMCTTVRSAGDRRGAMMATMCDTHPDLVKFILAKQTKGRLTNFNVSILVSDAFMGAIEEDADWLLHFHVEPWGDRDPNLSTHDFVDEDGTKQYIYSKWKARDLWRLITKSTYEYSEPGVIFIDRINELNNLNYCEDIRCTNPCGEQPLPPHASCNLGHINLARMVFQPFTANAYFDFDLLKEVVAIGVRFLDNVIDVTNYPLEEQKLEQYKKRRIGLGFTGLADAMAMLRLRYGNAKSADFAEKVMQTIAEATYTTSSNLAVERGSFPAFDEIPYLDEDSGNFVSQRMPVHIQTMIREQGIRNGVLNTVAPTGTTSIVYGNPAGGIEPTFALETRRKVLQADGVSYKEYTSYGYAAKLFKHMFGEDSDYPSYMVTTSDLKISDHLLIQSRVQRWVDASISKTLNIPTEMPYEEFVEVYSQAYAAGCKGCTTYRPSDVRGSILTDASKDNKNNSGQDQSKDSAKAETEVEAVLRERPEVLSGQTIKIKWPNRASAIYLTINSDQANVPFEVFITSKDGTNAEWTTALSLMITAIFRKGGNVSFITSELKQIQSVRDGAWIKGKWFGSLPAYIGHIIEKHLGAIVVKSSNQLSGQSGEQSEFDTEVELEPVIQPVTYTTVGEICTKCNAPAVSYVEGCKKCTNCGDSECG